MATRTAARTRKAAASPPKKATRAVKAPAKKSAQTRAAAKLRQAVSESKTIDPGWTWDDRLPLAQAKQVGNTIYVSGQVAYDANGNLVGAGDMKAQTRQVYENLKTVLAA
ncbi:MAG: RidA family protein, partial [Candidatus Binatia bacterium]|nr:RidA family protein [Candidatus Binatia bacterium]